jgi:2-oxoglutarate ferredoxin oxidoreductase subunit delta
MAKGTVIIDQERCKGCGLCPTVCPKDALAMDLEKLNAKGYHPAVLIQAEACTGCAICAVICPDVCITVLREPATTRVAALS